MIRVFRLHKIVFRGPYGKHIQPTIQKDRQYSIENDKNITRISVYLQPLLHWGVKTTNHHNI